MTVVESKCISRFSGDFKPGDRDSDSPRAEVALRGSPDSGAIKPFSPRLTFMI